MSNYRNILPENKNRLIDNRWTTKKFEKRESSKLVFRIFLFVNERRNYSPLFAAIGELHVEWLHCRFPMNYNLVSVLAWPFGYLLSADARAGFSTREPVRRCTLVLHSFVVGPGFQGWTD